MSLDRHGNGDLERRLEQLAPLVEFPASVDLTASVVDQLRTRPGPRRWAAGLSRRALALAALVALVLAASALSFSPTARRAVADWLGLPGIRIESEERPSKAELGSDLHLGRRTTLERARSEVSFSVRTTSLLGPPDEVYVASEPPGGRVSLLYRATRGLPPAAGTDVGLLLTQFRATIERELIQKGVSAGATVKRVNVGGETGYWVGGEPHFMMFLGSSGFPIEETRRLADHTLVWEDEDVVLRLESSLSLRKVLPIARSIQ